MQFPRYGTFKTFLVLFWIDCILMEGIYIVNAEYPECFDQIMKMILGNNHKECNLR